jgi:hypothetical protein
MKFLFRPTEYLWVPVLLLVVAACSSLNTPTINNHTPPQAGLDFSAFDDSGCTGEPGQRKVCQADSSLKALGCHELREPSALLGFLKPDLPLIYCVVHPSMEPGNPMSEIERLRDEGSFIKQTGGLDPIFFRFAIARNGEFEVLETIADFQEVYAPIESPEEALSYALALTNLRAYYGLAYDPELEYFVSEIEDTYVEPVAGSYEVHLFSYREFGCGPHPTSSVVMQVGSDGSLNETSRTQVFKDPSEDNLCVD